MAEYADFNKIDIRSGTIIKAEPFERARNPSYKVWVDFGPEIGTKTTSAQITQRYALEDLPGKKVLGVVNIGERNIAGFLSQFLLLGLPDNEGHILLASYDSGPVPGAKLC
jgi:tRNA-binding protein